MMFLIRSIVGCHFGFVINPMILIYGGSNNSMPASWACLFFRCD